MKKKLSSIGNIFIRLFNFRAWLDFDRIKSFTLYFFNGLKKLFVPQKNAQGETFDQAITRLNINEEELKRRQSGLYRLSLIMSGLASLIFVYAIYHLINLNIRAVIISLVVMLIALALAFRYHFWYFQIKERRLGCTMQEWFRKGLMGEK